MRTSPLAIDRAAGFEGSDGSTEVLYRSRQTLVTRASFARDGARVILKKPLGADAPARLRHETRILERLAGIEGVPQLADGVAVDGCIAMSDVEGVPLSEVLNARPYELSKLLNAAIELAEIVAAMHSRGVLHKDINPANILLAGEHQRVALIDFALATTYTQERPNFTHHKQIEGTLPYLAPEQTGRSGRLVDQRSDLYAVGVTLYELATGHLPFEQRDALQLIHDHLVRTPRAPASIVPSLPPILSQLIMRLLEKEPDRRYQSAAGLAHDLIRLKDALTQTSAQSFALAERDFPSILLAPSQLIGREPEVAMLREAFASALCSAKRTVFISGPPGVGKTALVDSLRTVATERRGWLVSGKFDQIQSGTAGVRQALGALGRLLLAEPEEELASQRQRITRALGTRAASMSRLVPELAIILGRSGESDASESLETNVQQWQSIVDLLRAIASPDRPLVVFLDDIQWAGAQAVGFIEAIVGDETLRGLLLVGSYRNGEVGVDHPLALALKRWKHGGTSPQLLHLDNLALEHLGTLIAEILRLPAKPAAQLAETIGARTAGNPFDTVELLNALRRDGILVPGGSGWAWDDARIRRYIGTGDTVVDLLAVRIGRLEKAQRHILSVISFLGGEVELAVLDVALEASPSLLIDRLETPLEDGLIVLERNAIVRFSHDRVQQAAYERIAASERAEFHLMLARRLAGVEPLTFAAAQQYVCAIDRVCGPDETRKVVDILSRAAIIARTSSAYADAERFLAAAITLLESVANQADGPSLERLQCERHAALYGLVRYAEADVVYRSLEQSDPDILVLATAACVQVCSLANRGLQNEAVAVGLALLARLGVVVPHADIALEVEHGLDTLQAWIDAGMPTPLSARSIAAEPKLLLIARLVACTMPSAFFSDPIVSHWLGLQRQQLWLEHGCAGVLASGLVGNAFALMGLRGDYRRAYLLARYACAATAGLNESDASRTRHIFALAAAHWGEPLDGSFSIAKQAREELIKAGDVQFACYTYFASLPALLECAPSLDRVIEEAESAIAFALRTTNAHVSTPYISYRSLAQSLQSSRGSIHEDSNILTNARTNPAAVPSKISAAIGHINLALFAAIVQDDAALAEHTAAAMPILPEGFYIMAVAHVLRALALASSVRSRVAQRLPFADELHELDTCLAWIEVRAADAPDNFLHLARFIDAERAWALGEAAAAAKAFDVALSVADSRVRPWHRALISERAGLFFLETGLERAAGRALLDEARRHYADWGATAKVAQLEERHAFLTDFARDINGSSRDTARTSSDSLDLIAILNVSQALNSETNVTTLRKRIAESLGAMTGASVVHVAVFDDRKHRWFVSAGDGGEYVGVEEAAARGSLPLTAFRYVERTREPLLVADAKIDDRFARDPYLAGLERCSLLVVPILHQGVLRAILILENKLSAGTFTVDRLDAVTLLAGQLAVSLENASLYTSLEEQVLERTEALQLANRQLEALSITDSLTGLANRRRFVEFLDAEWKRALREQTELAVAIVDVDHFKRYNDRYGHLAGDVCLQLVANEMDRQLRKGLDLVARYGGEEFGIVLPRTGAAAARAAAERVRYGVEALAQPHASSEAGIVTVSIGVATLIPQVADGSRALIAAADAALYNAKTNGRNRIWFEGDAAKRLVAGGEPAAY